MRIFGMIRKTRKVTLSLPILTWVAIASHAGEIASGPKTPRKVAGGDQTMARASREFRQHPSISAKIRSSFNLYGKHLKGTGSYHQQSAGYGIRLRLELKIQMGERTRDYLQVSDGRYLWLYGNVTGGIGLSRIDLDQLRQAVPERIGDTRAELDGPPMSLGGLPELLEQLIANFRFHEPQPDELHGVRVSMLVGEWRRENLVNLLPERKQRILDGEPIRREWLPPNVPERVLVWLGQDDLFPYRIEFHRGETDLGQGIPIVIMQMFDVRIGDRLDPMLFTYRPPDGLDYEDRTEDYVKRVVRKKPRFDKTGGEVP